MCLSEEAMHKAPTGAIMDSREMFEKNNQTAARSMGLLEKISLLCLTEQDDNISKMME
jgi:hypothetical protein